MDTVFFVDWLSLVFDASWMNLPPGTQPTDKEAEIASYILTHLGAWKACKPRWGYLQAWRDALTGAVTQYHAGRPDMGLNVIYPGKSLSLLNWRDVLRHSLEKEGRPTRIDLTVDVRNPEFDLPYLYDHVVGGEIISSARNHRYITSSGGDTLYVGSRTSEKMLRVYDKGAEQGGQPGVWFRVELEMKGNAARWAAPVLLDASAERVMAIITGFFDAPKHPGWVAAIHSAIPAERIPSDKSRPDTEAWLMTLVAKTLAAAERRRPGFMDDFIDEALKFL
jgi:hypothetical protein